MKLRGGESSGVERRSHTETQSKYRYMKHELEDSNEVFVLCSIRFLLTSGETVSVSMNRFRIQQMKKHN